MYPREHPCVEQFGTLGPLLSATGMALEDDRDAISPLMDHVLSKVLALIDVPSAFNGFRPEDHGIDYRSHDYSLLLAIIERLSRFDASGLMAMPGPSLAGAAVSAMGTDQQKRHFFTPYLTGTQPTFLAITEPSGGSDAANCETTLRRDGNVWRLKGRKVLIGGAKRAQTGLVFARLENTSRRVLVMVHPREHLERFQVERLPTVGLAGADLTEIVIDDVVVEDEMVIGTETRSLRDGFLAINTVFSRHRPLVAAMALGTAKGILDQMRDVGADKEGLVPLYLRHRALLGRMASIGAAFECGKATPQQTSQFKMDAVALVDAVAAHAFETLALSDLTQAPQLLKHIKDGRAFEYMEGSSHIHLLQAYRTYQPRH